MRCYDDQNEEDTSGASAVRAAPLRQNLSAYVHAHLRADLIAGSTVAAFAVPQAMAYAMLAGVPPIHGLYTAIVMSIVAALMGSSAFVNSGPTNSAALLTAAALMPFAGRPDYMGYIATLGLLAGLIRLAMGLAKMGVLLDFVPESAFLGFTIGAGLLISMGQLHHLISVAPSDAAWFPARLWETANGFSETNSAALCIGLATLVVMLLFNGRCRKLPVALLAMGSAAIAAWLLRDHHPVQTVRDVATIPFGLPALSVPLLDIQTMRDLLPAAFAIAVIGLIEAASIGQTLALRRNQRIDVNQEFIGQGASQIAGAFLSCIPGSGSFSRSLLIETSGGVTRFANVYFGLATMIAVLAIPRLLEWIPVSALAGLLLYIGLQLVDLPRLRRVLATSTADSAILITTFLITVFYRIEYGIFAGMIGAALIHLHRTRQLQLVEYIPAANGRLAECSYENSAPHEPAEIVALGISGDLYYGLASSLRDQLTRILDTQHPRHLVLRVRRAYSIDYSCWSVLFDIADYQKIKGGRLYLCGVRPDVQTLVRQAGMEDVLPDDSFFPATESPFQAFDRCIASILPRCENMQDPHRVNWYNRSGTVDPAPKESSRT